MNDQIRERYTQQQQLALASTRAYQMGREDERKVAQTRDRWITWGVAAALVLLYHIFFSGWGC